MASPTVFSGSACSAMPGMRSSRARTPQRQDEMIVVEGAFAGERAADDAPARGIEVEHAPHYEAAAPADADDLAQRGDHMLGEHGGPHGLGKHGIVGRVALLAD